MKKLITLLLLCTGLMNPISAQTKPKQKTSMPSEMQRQMAEAMKDLSPEEQAQMKGMMNSMMQGDDIGDQVPQTAPIEFKDNKALVPLKDEMRIASIPKKKLSNADMGAYAGILFTKIMAKGEPDEIALLKSILPKATTAADLQDAAILSMYQGHPQAALGLNMKAVQKDPSNSNLQNNLAALLTQYGYAEQAIPILDKLVKEFPYNSTVLNNLGQAWFSLGEMDSTSLYIGYARMANPYNTEAALCAGIMEELNGDPIKAIDDYVEVFEQQPDLMVETILKNKTNNNYLDKIDFNKLRKNITVYEFFPKKWIDIPVFSNDVENFPDDTSLQNGYSNMFEDLKKKIEELGEAAEQQMVVLGEQGETEFINAMMKENKKGINKMSRTAVTINLFLNSYMNSWYQQYLRDASAFEEMVSKTGAQMTASGKNDKCADWDRKNNAYMEYINPKIRDFYRNKINEFTNWLNAYCTWAWYVTGNPKNVTVSSIINWMDALESMYEEAAISQKILPKSCVTQNEGGNNNIFMPAIPNISCPTIVNVPVGNEWQQLSDATKNFDGNRYGIKNNPTKAVPNQTVLISTIKSSIALSGISPGISTNGGSTVVTNIEVNEAVDRGLMEGLKKIRQKQGNGDNLDLAPLMPVRNYKLSKLLQQMMSADCKNVRTPEQVLKESLDKGGKDAEKLADERDFIDNLEDSAKKGNEMIDEFFRQEALKEEREKMIKLGDELIKELDKEQFNKELQKFSDALNKATDDFVKQEEVREYIENTKKMAAEIINAEANQQAIKNNGFQPTINTGVQAPGAIQPQKGLFQ